MELTEIDYNAIDNATQEFFRDGHIKTKCPRCGNLLVGEGDQTAWRIFCEKLNCLSETFRGI